MRCRCGGASRLRSHGDRPRACRRGSLTAHASPRRHTTAVLALESLPERKTGRLGHLIGDEGGHQGRINAHLSFGLRRRKGHVLTLEVAALGAYRALPQRHAGTIVARPPPQIGPYRRRALSRPTCRGCRAGSAPQGRLRVRGQHRLPARGDRRAPRPHVVRGGGGIGHGYAQNPPSLPRARACPQCSLRLNGRDHGIGHLVVASVRPGPFRMPREPG